MVGSTFIFHLGSTTDLLNGRIKGYITNVAVFKKNSNFGQGKKNDEHTSLMWLQYFSRIFKESTGHLGIQSQGI